MFESKLWDISDLGESCIRLVNDGGEIKFINMDEYVKKRGWECVMDF